MFAGIQQADVAVLLWIQEYLRAGWWTPFWKGITVLGDGGWFWIVLSLILIIPKRTRKTGVTAVIALAVGALVTNVLLKNAAARIRPYDYTQEILLLIGKQWDYSFPSGHSCASFAAAYVFFKKFPKRYGIACLVLAGLIAFSRLYVGVHYPTDVICGIMIGLGAGWLAVFLSERLKILKKI